MAQLEITTETEMARQALGLVRVEVPLESLEDDPSYPARVCRKFFGAVRDALLEQQNWTFAEWYAQLPALADPKPPFKWKNFFALPGDCLSVREVNDCAAAHWKTIGRMLACDQDGPINLTYTRRVVEVAQWEPLFRRLFVCDLASAIAPELAQDERIAGLLAQAREVAEQNALPADSAQQTPDTLQDFDFEFLRARG